MASSTAADWIAQNFGLFIAVCVLYIVLAFTLICVRSLSRKVPINYILLAAFTLCVSYMVAACVCYISPEIVMTAAAVTAVVVIALTGYAYYTKTDFTICAPLMIVIGFGLMFCILFALIFSFSWGNIFISFACVVIFGFYIIFDTQLILGKGRYQIGMDDYILGAVIIYIDIINLFLELLKIFSR